MDFEDIAIRARQNLTAWQKISDTAKSLSALQIKAVISDYVASTDTPPDTAALRHLAESLLDMTASGAPSTAKNRGAIAFLDALLDSYSLPLPEEHSLPPQPLPQGPLTVAHFESSIFADATARFSPLVGNLTSLPTESFTAAADEVSNGKATFALLPIEDDAEGKLTRFYEQIARFELHVSAALDMAARHDGKQVRVALVGKNRIDLAADERPRALECLLFEEDRYSLATLLDTANAIGLSLRRIDSLPIFYREDGFSKHLVFEGPEQLCRKLHTYVTIFMPRTSVTAEYVLL